MRPGQNRRMRGRNNNNRGNNNKGPNPLTKSYESNGPDVKIRGTAQHIAEKYSQLARDAQASGDPVAARSEEHTSELQSRQYLVCRLLLEKKKIQTSSPVITYSDLTHS